MQRAVEVVVEQECISPRTAGQLAQLKAFFRLIEILDLAFLRYSWWRSLHHYIVHRQGVA